MDTQTAKAEERYTQVAIYKGYEYWITICIPKGKSRKPFYQWSISRQSGLSKLGAARSMSEAIDCVKKVINILEAIKS